MKLRTGFVSNSSSSSFAIFGAMFDSWDSLAEEMFSEEEIKEHGPRELVEERVGEKGFSAYDTEYEGVYIGVDAGGIFEYMKSGETKEQFLARVSEELKDALKLVSAPKVKFLKGEYPC